MKIQWLPLLALCAACGGGAPGSSGREAAEPGSTQTVTAIPAAGMRSFAIVPGESRASYHATEEFFAGAMQLLGIKAGRVTAVGTTQAIEGTFLIDTTRAVPILGDNAFTVRLNTLTSDQQKRDDYLREIRDDGPSFDAYPLATFKATGLISHSAGGESGDPDYQIPGDLTVRQITKRVVFDVKGRVAGDTFSGAGATRILLSDFGIGPIEFAGILSVADPVEIEVLFTARARP